MKKLLFLLLAITLFSCKESKKDTQIRNNYHFEIGDLVYIKPDSIKGIVSYADDLFPNRVTVDYKDSLGAIHSIVLNKKLLIKQQ